MEKEIWRAVEGYEGLYEVSNLGNVRNIKKGKIMSQWKCKCGYWFVGLNRNGKQKFYKVHRLVAEAFIPNPNNKPQVDHINGDKNENYEWNLRWATASENVRNPNTYDKLVKRIFETRTPVRAIRNGKVIYFFSSITEAAKRVNGLPGNICNALKGKQKSSYGLQWEYA